MHTAPCLRRLARLCLAIAALLTYCSPLTASIVTTNGAVTALTDVTQLLGIIATANFDEGRTAGAVPLATYTPQGMTLRTGDFSTILPGITTSGTAEQPYYQAHSNTFFPTAIAGGGTHVGQSAYRGLVATFNTSVTQIGLTASQNGTQYLTAWDASGAFLGQVKRVPQADSGFIGIDTQGVPIAMLAYGNDDLSISGATYNIADATPYWDTMIWASGTAAAPVPEPLSLLIWAINIVALFIATRRSEKGSEKGTQLVSKTS